MWCRQSRTIELALHTGKYIFMQERIASAILVVGLFADAIRSYNRDFYSVEQLKITYN
jgi:hypothetical protein